MTDIFLSPAAQQQLQEVIAKIPRLRNGAELAPLARLLPKQAKVLELGVFAGESTQQFLKYANDLQMIFCVDSWAGHYDPDDLASEADMEIAETVFRLTAATDQRVAVFRMDLMQLAEMLAPAQFDMIYLDADHRYESVKKSLKAWIGKIKSGGYFAGHDYGEPTHPGVKKAVDEFFLGRKPDVLLPDTSWAYWVINS